MPPNHLDKNKCQALLQLARQALTRAVTRQANSPIETSFTDQPSHGAFVTLHSKGLLRGCIGTFAAGNSLVATIVDMAAAAGLRDPRFSPVTHAELNDIDIEISVLTPLVRVEDAADIQVGVHGICIEQGWHRGVLLPQVATENHWDRETFLAQTCLKAGLPLLAWRNAETRIETFSAQVFGEKEH